MPYIWQIAFILLATTWLWAPLLNHQISSRVSLISQYEAPGQPYSWLFRLGDILGAAILLIIPLLLWYRRKMSTGSWLLLIIAVGSLIDALLPTSCRMIGNSCQEYVSASYIIHAIETVITASAIFGLAAYDYLKRKRLLSASFVLFQILYGLLFLTQLASNNHFNTASQYIYQTVLVLWLAWYVRDKFWQPEEVKVQPPTALIKNFFAVWALLNGILAILVSLAHIHVLGKIEGVYFANDNAWLAQHGVVVGMVMIYLSRHLARGERRARHIFLLIIGIEALKYSVVAPQPLLLALYLLTFCALFVTSESFERGPSRLTWDVRFKDATFFLASALSVVVLAFILLGTNNRKAAIVNRSIDHFFDYTVRPKVVSRVHIRSALLAHTESAFILAGAATLLWILFKPQPTGRRVLPPAEVERLLKTYSNSSEDYFKLWPPDKDYFRALDIDGLVAYKIVGPIAFALADPITTDNSRQKLLSAFMGMAREKNLRVCFLPIAKENVGLYQKAGLAEMQIGATALINVNKFAKTTARDKWWRWKINRALKAAYQYKQSQPPHPPELVQQIKSVSDAWLGHAGRKEYGFAMGHFDEDYLNQTAVDYLEDVEGRVVAFTNNLPLFRPNSVTTIDLFRYTPDAIDAMPYLLMKSIEEVGKEGKFKYFDLGFVPFAKARGTILTIARTLSDGRFSARGLEQFKNKFDPEWQPIYMAYDGDLADLALIAVNLERAMELKTG